LKLGRGSRNPHAARLYPAMNETQMVRAKEVGERWGRDWSQWGGYARSAGPPKWLDDTRTPAERPRLRTTPERDQQCKRINTDPEVECSIAERQQRGPLRREVHFEVG
jgi:hypothetical protein